MMRGFGVGARRKPYDRSHQREREDHTSQALLDQQPIVRSPHYGAASPLDLLSCHRVATCQLHPVNFIGMREHPLRVRLEISRDFDAVAAEPQNHRSVHRAHDAECPAQNSGEPLLLSSDVQTLNTLIDVILRLLSHPTRSANVCHHRRPFWPADTHSKVAILKSRRISPVHPWAHSLIRIDSICLATESMEMRAGTETALTKVIGAAKPHCAYLLANRRANRMKVLLHDGFGIWLAARRLNQGKFHWPGIRQGLELELNTEQPQALVLA